MQSYDLMIEKSDASYHALAPYRSSQPVDFADALIAFTTSHAGTFETVTFDRKAAIEAGMRLLESAWSSTRAWHKSCGHLIDFQLPLLNRDWI